jgi:glyoxylase-like metal-dependent hydrolase (beta-lactamase superfamily II)
VDVTMLRPGLWRWTAPHPDWKPKDGGPDGWEHEVSSYAYVAPDAFVLFDPLAPPDGSDDAERFWTAVDRDVEGHGPPQVLLTVYWHARSAQAFLDRYEDARVWGHEPAGKELGERVAATDLFRAGDELPGRVEALEAMAGEELLYWVPEHGAVVAGDVLLGTPDGGIRVCPDSWLGKRTTPTGLREELRRTLDRPVRSILPTHGEPVLDDGRAALDRALAS